MSDHPKSNLSPPKKRPEYSKPEVEVLGDLRELTEGQTPGTSELNTGSGGA